MQVADVGLATYGRRRVSGLRREEIAVLAGVSADYYARLEQGRETNPSAQVLDALVRALQLDEEVRGHVQRLAHLAPDGPATRSELAASTALVQLMTAASTTPAFVLSSTLDVLATNDLADALFSPFTMADNLVRMVFLDPAGRPFHADWDEAAHAVVAALALARGYGDQDHRIRELVGELTASSDAFTALWQAGDVADRSLEAKQLVHPDVGPLDLIIQAFEVRSAPGQQLMVCRAEPGSISAHSLDLLGATKSDSLHCST